MIEETMETGLEIAVIGMDGRFPGAGNTRVFWENLAAGRESVSFLNDEELRQAGVTAAVKQRPDFVKADGGILEDIEYFDAHFFDYTPMEAEQMAPPLRIFHECIWEALEDAAYDPYAFNRLIGLYTGASSTFNWELLSGISAADRDLDTFVANYLSSRDYIGTLIAYRFNLKGPAFFMHTACSTSLVAIHLACQGLLAGDCHMALAGGIGLRLRKEMGYIYTEGMILSADGHCRAFDTKASGTVCGDGVGVVVLKRLEDAVNDRDNIYAVIKGSAINNDGNQKVGFTAPGVDGQVMVIRRALRMAEVKSEDIGYVETHGTGTPLGDVTEVEALKIAFNNVKQQSCALGSVKTNIGHLDTAAGAAGFIKTVLALKHQKIPPSLHFQEANPEIGFEKSPFYVNTTLKDWNGNKGRRRAGVSSFGIGGTNAHIILEEAPRRNGRASVSASRPGESARQYRLVLLSAKTGTALDKMSENLALFLENNLDVKLADVAYTLQVGRKRFPFRRKLVCSTIPDAIAGLRSVDSRTRPTFQGKDEKKPVVFMFSGLGSQYVDMGRGLYETEPVFRREIDRCAAILEPLLGFDIKAILYPGISAGDKQESQHGQDKPAAATAAPDNDLNRTEIAQLVVFIFEYSLARLLMAWGITPRAMIGYSFGEYAAACLSGVFSLEDALKILAARGRLLQELPAGMMLSVPLSAAEVEPLLSTGLSIGIDNGASCVVSGPQAAVKAFEKQMKERKLLCMPLDSRHAVHSTMMAPILDRFAATLDTISMNSPKIPYISGVTGKWITVEDAVSPQYWARQMHDTVRFAGGIRLLLKEPDALFLEVGTGRDISALVRREIPEQFKHQVVNLVKHGSTKKEISDTSFLLDKIGLLWLYGLSPDWSKFYPGERNYRLSLPTYPFEKHRFWQIVDEYEEGKISLKGLLDQGKSRELADCFFIPTWKRKKILDLPDKAEETRECCWWVFSDQTGLGDRLAAQIKQTGQHRVIVIKPGETFQSLSSSAYEINPRQSADYEALVVKLNSMGSIPRRILHLWGVTGEKQDSTDPGVIEENQVFGFFSLLYIMKALGQHCKYSESIELSVVTDNMQEVTGTEDLAPGKATILGLCRVIPQEYPDISCKSIDMTYYPIEDLSRQLWQEITLPAEDSVVAYRGNHRWVQAFDPVRLETCNSPVPSLLRRQGVYLVIGGLGDIGFTLARYLIKEPGAKLILTGRTPLPPKEMWNQYLIVNDKNNKVCQFISRLQQLQEMGGEVAYYIADVTNIGQMQAAIAGGEEQFGPVNGVIHSAGITRGDTFNYISDITVPQCQKQFQGKVYGLPLLKKLLQGKSLDFCLMISSISTVLGGLGFVAYSAANHFVDAFSAKINQNKQEPWIIVDWDGTNPGDTADAFQRIFSRPSLEQVVFSVDGDLEGRISRWVQLEDLRKKKKLNTGSSAPLYSRPELSNPYVAPRSAAEQKLADIWQRFFGIEKIGVTDDLFDLGGDSLKAINIIAVIHREMNVTIPIKEFFDHSTIEGVAAYIAAVEPEEFISIGPVEKKEYYTVSPAQKRLYFLQQMEKESFAYNSPQVLSLAGDLTEEKLTQTFRQLIQRHESLRTSIRMVREEPVQVIQNMEELDFEIEHYEMTGPLEKGNDNSRLELESIKKSFIRAFDLALAPLLRVGLVKCVESRHLLMFDIHHTVTDGVSLEVIVRELMRLYPGQALPLLRLQYKDFSEWQKRFFIRESQKMGRQERYWLNQFAHPAPVLDLSADFPRPPVQTFSGKAISFKLNQDRTKALKEIVRQEEATLFMIILAVFNILLAKLSGQGDIVIGSPILGRQHSDLESIVGVFVNMLALRNYPGKEKTFTAFLKELKENTIAALDNQDYQFEALVEQLQVERDPGRHPLFDVTFAALPSVDIRQMDKPEKLNLHLVEIELQTAKFDLGLEFQEIGQQLLLNVIYSTTLFKEQTASRFVNYLKEIIDIVIESKDIYIKEILITHDLVEPESVVPEVAFKF